ncbi:hypothetical protein ATI61_106393 [Archangium gephyra]|uniref:Lipoprotein n=1 Tax=Archangium gephyra TaxID=48 RepID=A0AAC8Q170_9BACT|nr:hypothetical protein [Archangium gephyra]AKI99013.1 Hypothetical protein AA314_00640 [Archangium gephyra]REG30923.1 hypothetical protein ATI61_106393 [Archangium gephyra]
MFKQAIVVVTAALALAGCDSVCSRAERVQAGMADKVRPCEEKGFSVRAFDLEKCEEDFQECTDADKQAADEFLDCWEKVRTCSPDNTEPFANELEACLAEHPMRLGCQPF